MQTMRTAWPFRSIAALVFVVALLAWRTTAQADNGNASPTLSFFSGGIGAYADWLATVDQPAGDTDNQAIRLITVDDAPTFQQGYAGILFHHVTGIPAETFPSSAFWVKTPAFTGPSLGSPRLVVEFQDALGNFVGYGALRPETLGPEWQEVSDATFVTSGWDVMGGSCGYLYKATWNVVQDCFSGDTTLSVFIVADAYGISHLIDDITVNGKTFSSASDNGGGNNDPAGPTATTDPSLLPAILPLPQAQ